MVGIDIKKEWDKHLDEGKKKKRGIKGNHIPMQTEDFCDLELEDGKVIPAKERQAAADAAVSGEDIVEDFKESFTRRGQIEAFWEKEPFFYDSAKLFWRWNREEYKWVLSDEVDFCNLIYDTLGIETINSKAKAELVEGFKQIGRRHQPKEIEKRWVQYKNKIYDGRTGKELFEASPEYFVTNPIPWEVGKSEDTPTMDKIFAEWVDPKYVDTLFEIIAYNTCLDKYMQMLFGLCGGGSNGKGTYMKVNYKFLGKENCVSSEIKALSEDRFEPAVLYRKLLCVMGEVSHSDLRNTNMLKKLGGEDPISFQFKGKTPFTGENTTTIACLTNSMPITPDKSIGFYRKWMLIDFPNQFDIVKGNFIDRIPEVEFNNLAKKSLRILKELYERQEFTNGGTFEDRAKRYEERSNPVMRFVEEFCEEEPGQRISLRDFTNHLNKHIKIQKLRPLSAIQIGKILRNEGFVVGARNNKGVSEVSISNIMFKNYPNYPNYPNSESIPYVELTQNLDSLDSSNSFLQHFTKKEYNMEENDTKKNDTNDTNDTAVKEFTEKEIKEAGYDTKEFEELIK